MSLERKFHKLIEEQNRQEKEKKWQALKPNLEVVQNEEINNSGNTKALFKPRAKALICGIALFIVLLVIITTVIIYQNSNKKISIRYCTSEEYSIINTDITLKDYAISNNKRILFFDWYEETPIWTAEIIKLDNTDEIICFHETMIDMEAGYIVSLRVTDNRTEIDFLDSIKEMCKSLSEERGLNIEWGGNTFGSYAIFEYDGYKYYIEVTNATAMNNALDYVSVLLGY